MPSQFLRDISEYKRDINVVSGYFEQIAYYLHLHTAYEESFIKDWLRKEFGKGGKFEFKPPRAVLNYRDPQTGDRSQISMSIADYISTIIRNELIVAPSFTALLPPKVVRSLHSIFIDGNIDKRGKVKKEMQNAKAAGLKVLADNKKNEQNSLKRLNNAMSGAYSSKFTALFNKSTHSVLTSLTRSATSYGNANNEKMISGSRHYWAPSVIINNILSVCKLTDFSAFADCMQHYNIHYPTIAETMACIRHSSDHHFKNELGLKRVESLVNKLSPIERAAFVYIGDLYHLAKYNDALVRGLLKKFIEPSSVLNKPASEVESKLDGDTIALTTLLRADLIGTSNMSQVKSKNPPLYEVLLATADHIYGVIDDYSLLIRELFTTKNVPASIAKMPEMQRRVSLLSDTDSTMATAQWWSEWWGGEISGKTANAVADSVIYMSVQSIAHLMARMSANIGVEERQIFRYAMKNEYKFSSFTLTSKAKHYFAIQAAQEGTIYEDPPLELKGVALRTSNIPDIIMDRFRALVKEISLVVAAGDKIKIFPIIKEIAGIERTIKNSILNGEYTYLKTGQIRAKEAYTNPDSAAWQYYELWEQVFADKYGAAGEPPYGVVKVSLDVPNKTALREWMRLVGDTDPALGTRLANWVNAKGKSDFKQMLLPESILAVSGIPQEVILATDIRRVVFSSVEPFYHLMEALGFPMITDNHDRLFSDYY